MPQSVIAGLYGSCILGYKEFAKLFSRVTIPFYIPTSHKHMNRSSFFLLAFRIVTIFYLILSDSCVVLSHCGFNLHFPNG